MVGYVDPGMDATVSDKGIDFKFSNSYNNPIYLYSLVNGNKIDIRVFGKNDDLSTKIEFESEVTQILYPETEQVIKDKNLKSGVRVVEYTSKNGYRANLYKKVYKDNILVSRELVSQNIYRPLRGKIRIGI
jgi:vancomycin resistance protein YoaR